MKKRKLNKKMLSYLITIMLFLVLLVYSSINIILWFKSNSSNDAIQKIVKESIKVEEKSKDDKEKYNIDFKKLKSINPDTVGYIKVENTLVDYVVVKTDNNDYYLNHNFNKEWNMAGWIFADYKNKIDGTDKNIVIYGHNTRNGSMFGSLNKTLDEEWYQYTQNLTITFVTEKGTDYYRIFSIYKIPKEDYYITTDFKNGDEYVEFIDTIKKRSIFDFDEKMTVDDNILTLSTCAPGGQSRVVIHAKRIKN